MVCDNQGIVKNATRTRGESETPKKNQRSILELHNNNTTNGERKKERKKGEEKQNLYGLNHI